MDNVAQICSEIFLKVAQFSTGINSQIKPRLTRANKTIEVWERVLLQGLFHKQVVVRSKYLCWRVTRDASYPRCKAVVGIAIYR